MAGAVAVVALGLFFATSQGGSQPTGSAVLTRPKATTTTSAATSADQPGSLPGMPPVLNPNDIYAADHVGELSPAVAGDASLVYVPNSDSDTVYEIDPATYKIVRQFVTGANPQHVVPSYDLKTLWVTNDEGNSLTPINPATGLPGPNVPVEDPYNLYFTPNGKYAIVVAEALQRLDFRDPHTMALVHSLPVPCPGVDHMDFSADGTFLVASCEFGAKLIKVDVQTQQVVAQLALKPGSKPQDVKLSSDGKTFYVADMTADGVWEVDASTFSITGFIPTGLGAHGLYVSRDSRDLYVSNRDEGSISVIDLASHTVVQKWQLPGGGSPDMGGVSADGRVLWLSGRYNSQVYAIDTTSGSLLARINVGPGPHGLAVFPQPGRYSLGHTGIFR